MPMLIASKISTGKLFAKLCLAFIFAPCDLKVVLDYAKRYGHGIKADGTGKSPLMRNPAVRIVPLERLIMNHTPVAGLSNSS
jgi:hypothetical protein